MQDPGCSMMHHASRLAKRSYPPARRFIDFRSSFAETAPFLLGQGVEYCAQDLLATIFVEVMEQQEKFEKIIVSEWHDQS
jgi:hypothetical protein